MRDVDVRSALLAELSRRHRGESVLIVEELGVCQGEARVDVAVINGAISGFEIKSDVDTLSRLKGQIVVYNRILDYAHLVTGSRHLDKAVDVIPTWWGVTSARREGQQIVLMDVRPSQPNPGVDARATVELLWRDEALAELKARGFAQGLSRAPRSDLWDKLASQVESDELRRAVCERVKARSRWRARPSPRNAPQSPWWTELLPSAAAS
jgi:hypothetical protein